MGIDVERPPDGDWIKIGLNYPKEYLLPRWDVWRQSGRVVWPNGKSMDEQSPNLIEDFMTLERRFAYHRERLKPRK